MLPSGLPLNNSHFAVQLVHLNRQIGARNFWPGTMGVSGPRLLAFQILLNIQTFLFISNGKLRWMPLCPWAMPVLAKESSNCVTFVNSIPISRNIVDFYPDLSPTWSPNSWSLSEDDLWGIFEDQVSKPKFVQRAKVGVPELNIFKIWSTTVKQPPSSQFLHCHHLSFRPYIACAFEFEPGYLGNDAHLEL